jgi:ComF family protein
LRFSAARAAGFYEGGLRTAIQQLKFHGHDALAQPLGRFLWQTLGRHWNPAQIDRVIPVPLHPRRLRERGFNQAAVLVREWPRLAKQEGSPVPPGWIDRHTLQRRRATRPQIGLKREERVANLRYAFQVNSRAPVSVLKNQRVLLVDDVMTTGATADACARALLSVGVADVRVLTLARAVVSQDSLLG